MSRPYWRVKHIGSMTLLPEKLTRGQAYFVDDEQVIVIDHGQGPVIYGGKPGPQGASGEPSPHLQEQINYLAEAETLTQRTIWEIEQRRDEKLAKLYADLAETGEKAERRTVYFSEQAQAQAEFLQEQISWNTNSIETLINILLENLEQTNNALAILTKAVANLYPSSFTPGDSQHEDPLDGETLSTENGSWTIQQTVLEDGMIVLELEAQNLLIDTLKVGDKVAYNGSEWTVSEYSVEDGMIRIAVKP